MAIPTDGELIRIALERSGVARDPAADAAFYSKANKAGALNYRDIRKFGTPVTAEEKADRGLRYRGVMTREFLATLNEAGLADPARAAELIATPMSGMLSTAKGLRNAYRSGIRQFIFGPGTWRRDRVKKRSQWIRSDFRAIRSIPLHCWNAPVGTNAGAGGSLPSHRPAANQRSR